MIGDTGVFNKTWALVGASEFKCAESSAPAAKNGQTDWPIYGGSPDNIHYSGLVSMLNLAFASHRPWGRVSDPKSACRISRYRFTAGSRSNPIAISYACQASRLAPVRASNSARAAQYG
jgi:hypothetical protein